MKHQNFLSFFLPILLLASMNTHGAIPSTERDALVALYNNTDGANWASNDGWLGAQGTECDWHGVVCDANGTTVVALYMSVNSMSGSLPAEMSALTNLREIYLRQNYLTGINPALGSLANLVELDLSLNQIDSIPPELGNLASLEKLALSDNSLGSIPAALGLLANLRELFLSRNSLSTIPAELGSLTNLTGLYLPENNLSSIPAALGQLAKLETLDLAFNDLTTIPSAIGDLGNLQELNLHENNLTSIPGEIGKLSNLRALRLRKNKLVSLPDELGNLASLEALYLEDNQLISIPTTLGKLSNLTELELNKNQISGPIPPELGNLTSLIYLGLNENQLTGGIPEELGKLSQLWKLDLRDNQLSGPIPGALSKLQNLEELILSYNQLDGPIPDSLGKLSKLKVFHLQGNKIGGAVPPEMADIPGVLELLIRYNALYASDQRVIDVLDGKDPFWRETQTIAPANVQATNITSNSVALSWNPIEYTDNGGGYQINFGTDPLGPYSQDGGATANKSINGLSVNGLSADTTYYLVVKTWTDAHALNPNIVWSNPGAVLCLQTGSGICPDDDGDGLPNTLDRDEHLAALMTLPADEQYGDRSDGSGNTTLSSCTGITTDTTGAVTVLAPHKMILKADEISILAGSVFAIKRGAELVISNEPGSCAK